MSEATNKASREKLIPIQCVYTQGMYPKLLKSAKRPQGLFFTNGVAVVSPKELEELKKENVWGRDIALRGELPRGAAAAPVKVKVRTPTKSEPARRKKPSGTQAERSGVVSPGAA